MPVQNYSDFHLSFKHSA